MTRFTLVPLGLVICLSGWMSAQSQTQSASKAIEAIEFRGLHSTADDFVRAVVVSKAGDVYSEEALRRDFAALWKTGRFEDIQAKTETGGRGGTIVQFTFIERK